MSAPSMRSRMRARYRLGFVAKYLRPLVFEKMHREGWRQYQVADWIGVPRHALSEYLSRRTHPSAERRARLLKLGCDEADLVRAELADKLEWWMRTNGATSLEVRESLGIIEAYRHELRQRDPQRRLA